MKRNDYDRIPVGPLVQPNPPWARIVARMALCECGCSGEAHDLIGELGECLECDDCLRYRPVTP
jgi:hypothetical protein